MTSFLFLGTAFPKEFGPLAGFRKMNMIHLLNNVHFRTILCGVKIFERSS